LTGSVDRTAGSVAEARWIVPAVILAALAAYFPFLSLPFISDDYIQLDLARKYGPTGGWMSLAADALYRCRATSLVLTSVIDHWFGLNASAHSAASLLIHVLNCLLVAAFGLWKPIGWRAAAIGAVFFAVHEGHQEAVVWVAALPELLVFFFALVAIHAWLLWLHDDRYGNLPLLITVGAYLLALLSKESGVVIVPLLGLGALVFRHFSWGVITALTAMGSVGVIYALAIFDKSATHLHLNDGTFNAAAPFWYTLVNSAWRIYWIWGFVAVAVLLALRVKGALKAVVLSLVWTLIALLPYAFLTYMSRVPSRHTYWASLSVAMLVGLAGHALWQRQASRLMAGCLLVAVLGHNIGYLWVKKLPQYERRAQATERFLDFARRTPGPIVIQCFPYGPEVAISAAGLIMDRRDDVFFTGKAPASATPYCDTEHP